jgi:hypothetical protein
MSKLTIVKSTFFKKNTAQSSQLTTNEKVLVNVGETFEYKPESLSVVGEHYRVELLQDMGSFGRVGYFYRPTVHLEESEFSNRLVRFLLSSEYWDVLRKAEILRDGVDNTCVAFASTALRRLGIDVPTDPLETSLVTTPFKNWLEDNVKLSSINNANSLKPGDICFSKDDPDWPGYPAHVYFFIEYNPEDTGAAYVVDNQGKNHVRNLDSGSPYRTPFAFAFRLTGFDLQVESVGMLEAIQKNTFMDVSSYLRKKLQSNEAF